MYRQKRILTDFFLTFQERGFYVECGALDGETRSNTLMLERLRKWNGLLIEADPSNYKNLKEKHRKAFSINACLSIYPFPVIVSSRRTYKFDILPPCCICISSFSNFHHVKIIGK